jgi:hypothetical protein
MRTKRPQIGLARRENLRKPRRAAARRNRHGFPDHHFSIHGGPRNRTLGLDAYSIRCGESALSSPVPHVPDRFSERPRKTADDLYELSRQ